MMMTSHGKEGYSIISDPSPKRHGHPSTLIRILGPLTLFAQKRYLRDLTNEFGFKRSQRYSGAIPLRALKIFFC